MCIVWKLYFLKDMLIFELCVYVKEGNLRKLVIKNIDEFLVYYLLIYLR